MCVNHPPELKVLPKHVWHAAAAAYRAQIQDLIGSYLEHRKAGIAHPVYDFLFTYYGHKPGALQIWHPGFGVALADAEPYAQTRGYHQRLDGTVTADPDFLRKRRSTIEFVSRLLQATQSRPAHLSCFGLHEWAMVYRSQQVRHEQVPLRLSRTEIDTVVESLPLRCTHFDAYRFFTPQAVGRNALPLSRAEQSVHEQPGCLHANMDLYKWGFKLTPLIPAELLGDCFAVAYTARELDMRASPYDLTEYGYTPIRIDTPDGRAEYVRQQAQIATRAAPIRERLLAACTQLLTA